jgi:hypothetical protein
MSDADLSIMIYKTASIGKEGTRIKSDFSACIFGFQAVKEEVNYIPVNTPSYMRRL